MDNSQSHTSLLNGTSRSKTTKSQTYGRDLLYKQSIHKIWERNIEFNDWIKDRSEEKLQEWSSKYVCYGVTFQVQLTCTETMVLTAQPALVFTSLLSELLNSQRGDWVSKASASIQVSKLLATFRGNLTALDTVWKNSLVKISVSLPKEAHIFKKKLRRNGVGGRDTTVLSEVLFLRLFSVFAFLPPQQHPVSFWSGRTFPLQGPTSQGEKPAIIR